MPPDSLTHLVLVPSYNTGAMLAATVAEAMAAWAPVWVVIDGSTDGSDALAPRPGLRVLRLRRNAGKGAAILHGITAAQACGFTHVLTMDADGQHDTGDIGAMMAMSLAHPKAMVLGMPVFDPTAPWLRVCGRRVSNNLADIATGWAGIADSLFGFRVYPIAPLVQAFSQTRFMRRFDFDPEAAIRLCWLGVRPVNLRSRVRYFSQAEGGVSHFRYLRDNALLGFMYVRLFAAAAWRGIRSFRR